MTATAVFVGLGSNLAHPRRQLARALFAIARVRGVRLTAVSGTYTSAPIACETPQPDYVNAVAAIRTTRSPQALLRALQAIERRQHRRRDAAGQRNAPRTLDLDLLLYGRRRIRLPGLTVPHPRMHERAFVLRPLAEICASAAIPGHGLARGLLGAVRNQRISRTRR